jgi:hypothetical protein
MEAMPVDLVAGQAGAQNIATPRIGILLLFIVVALVLQ